MHYNCTFDHSLSLLITPTRQNSSYLISSPNLVVFTAIKSPDRALSISSNSASQNLVVVERAVAEGVANIRPKTDHPPYLYCTSSVHHLSSSAFIAP